MGWGEPADGLRLGLVAEGGTRVRLCLENVGGAPLEVFSHVQADERHLDPFTVSLARNGGERRLRFVDMRDESSPVRVSLGAGEQLEHAVDLAEWALRVPNGAAPLEPGEYEARASYEVGDRPSGVWTGALRSGAVGVTAP